MSIATPVVFVLWAAHFEEEAATIFTTELRQAGVCTKIIGLDGDQSAGRYGMRLTPDHTLHEALRLVDCAICLVIPAGPLRMGRVWDDPRVAELLGRVAAHVPIVSGCDGAQEGCEVLQPNCVLCDPKPFGLPLVADWERYPANEDLVRYVRQLAQRLESKLGAL